MKRKETQISRVVPEGAKVWVVINGNVEFVDGPEDITRLCVDHDPK